MNPNPNKDTTKCNPEEEYDNLLQEFQEMNQPQETIQNGVITSLKGRAKQLLVWITLHKNHVDRHELADICKEGMETIMKIMKATNKTDTSELDLELMVLEARKTACEEAFAEDLKGFDDITPEIIDNLPPHVQVSIKTRIFKAKSNIYTTIDTPEGILDEIGGMHDKVKENRIDDIIRHTQLYTSRYFSLTRKQLSQKDLMEYIKERIDYMEDDNLLGQINSLLTTINNSYPSPTTGFILPQGVDCFIN